MDTITLKLPYPPSVNTYWRHPNSGKLAGRHLISQQGRTYRSSVLSLAKLSHPGKPLTGSLGIQIDAYPPDRRRRDLDNILKSLLDSLSHAGIIEDDSLFDRITIIRREVVPLGQIILQIKKLENET